MFWILVSVLKFCQTWKRGVGQATSRGTPSSLRFAWNPVSYGVSPQGDHGEFLFRSLLIKVQASGTAIGHGRRLISNFICSLCLVISTNASSMLRDSTALVPIPCDSNVTPAHACCLLLICDMGSLSFSDQQHYA